MERGEERELKREREKERERGGERKVMVAICLPASPCDLDRSLLIGWLTSQQIHSGHSVLNPTRKQNGALEG